MYVIQMFVMRNRAVYEHISSPLLTVEQPGGVVPGVGAGVVPAGAGTGVGTAGAATGTSPGASVNGTSSPAGATAGPSGTLPF